MTQYIATHDFATPQRVFAAGQILTDADVEPAERRAELIACGTLRTPTADEFAGRPPQPTPPAPPEAHSGPEPAPAA